MENKTKKKFLQAGATVVKKKNPFDHNEPGTPIAVKYTPTPPAPKKDGNPKKSTATTEHGRDSGDGKNMKPAHSKGKQLGGNIQSPRFDPDGSYTGVPNAVHKKPVQDADDL